MSGTSVTPPLSPDSGRISPTVVGGDEVGGLSSAKDRSSVEEGKSSIVATIAGKWFALVQKSKTPEDAENIKSPKLSSDNKTTKVKTDIAFTGIFNEDPQANEAHVELLNQMYEDVKTDPVSVGKFYIFLGSLKDELDGVEGYAELMGKVAEENPQVIANKVSGLDSTEKEFATTFTSPKGIYKSFNTERKPTEETKVGKYKLNIDSELMGDLQRTPMEIYQNDLPSVPLDQKVDKLEKVVPLLGQEMLEHLAPFLGQGPSNDLNTHMTMEGVMPSDPHGSLHDLTSAMTELPPQFFAVSSENLPTVIVKHTDDGGVQVIRHHIAQKVDMSDPSNPKVLGFRAMSHVVTLDPKNLDVPKEEKIIDHGDVALDVEYESQLDPETGICPTPFNQVVADAFAKKMRATVG